VKTNGGGASSVAVPTDATARMAVD
jgi:hypothetical protein